MTGAVAAARPHTDAVYTAIAATGLLVGRGVKPVGGGWQGAPSSSNHVPYATLYPTPGVTDGDLCDPNTYLDYQVQVTCVAATQEGAEAAMDLVKTALVGQRLPVEGRSSYRVYIDLSRPAARDDSSGGRPVAPTVHFAIAVFRFRTEPAT